MVQTFGLIMHFVMCYELVCVFGQREHGAAISLTVASIFKFLCLELYCCLSASVEETYTGFKEFRAVLEGLKAYFL